MRNKALIGGIIALAIIVLLGIFCFWVGKKIYDYNNKTDDTTTNNPNESKLPVQPSNAAEAQRVYLLLGNPSSASESDSGNYLMVNNYYALSYSRERGIPNWVSWRVTKADMGDLQRQDSFRPDDRLPENWKHIKPNDYTGSGYDKGHLCPSADRTSDGDANDATFLMTNMTPQTPDLNRGPWEKLESYLRTLVRRGGDVYIMAGVYGEQGKLKNRVTIPMNDWKIAVVIPAGSNLSAVNENTRVIAVDMPNVRGIKNADWQIYRTTVAAIEQSTGYKFFSNLPQNLQDALKNKKDNIND